MSEPWWSQAPPPCSTPELCATGVLLPLFITLSLSSIITIAILVTKSIPKDGVDLCVQGAGETGDQGLKADFVQWTHSGLAATRGRKHSAVAGNRGETWMGEQCFRQHV